ncbi:MAG: ABC transporter permease subunit [Spirochaetales bacterium]|nr:ABC transporter permease subunit [Spirochaetales bacterium]
MKNKVLLLLIFPLLAFILPVIVLILFTFSGIWQYPALLPATFNMRAVDFFLSNYEQILRSIGSSLAYSLSAAALTLVISILPARILARSDFKGKQAIEAILLAPALLPVITFSMGAHLLFIKWGLIDSFPGVVFILSIFTYPYMLRALITGFLASPPEIGICAENLGAGRIFRLLRIDLPLLLPSIVAGGTIVFLISFSEYFLVFLIGGGRIASYSGYLFPFLNSSDHQIGSFLTLLFLVAPLLLFLIIEFSITRMHRKMGLVH